MEPQRRRFIRSCVLLYATEFGLSDMPEPGIITPPPGIEPPSQKGPGEEGPEDIQGQREHMQEHQMELELQLASSTPVPDEGARQEQLDGNMNDATSERQNIKRQARATTSYASNEPLQTNQRMGDVTSEPPPTSLGLEEGNSGSVHVGSVQIATAEEHFQYALHDPIIHEHPLKAYPNAKLQEAMNREMQMMADFDVADVLPTWH